MNRFVRQGWSDWSAFYTITCRGKEDWNRAFNDGDHEINPLAAFASRDGDTRCHEGSLQGVCEIGNLSREFVLMLFW
jgi:hypothetical protein